MEPQVTQPSIPEQPKHKLRLHIDLRLVVLLLVIAMGVMLYLWKPWNAQNTANARTIEVTGSATVKSEPDEYVFYPTYEFKNPDKAKGLAEMTAKASAVTEALKKLGVADKSIKTNASDYNLYYIYEDGQNIYSLTVTVTVNDKGLAQKVQDYLVTTSPTGQITPSATFSEEKQNQLETEARTKAEKDARAKAEESAKNIGFKLGAVKTISEGGGFSFPGCRGDVCALGAEDKVNASSTDQKLTIQPGENDLTYTVQVTYFIK